MLLVDFVGSSGAVFLASSTIEDFGGRGFWKKFMVLTNIAETKIYIFTTGGSTGAVFLAVSAILAVAASTIFLDLAASALAAAASATFLD